MDAHLLVDPASSGALPAPWWFVQFFKALGFTLHMVPMNLWFAGLLVAMLLRVAGRGHAVVFSRRLMRQMPILVAYGVNFGIVPLLFVQLGYSQFFYPATILMAWFWLAIVVLLIPAYYGVYVYSFGLRDDDAASPAPWRRLAGWGSAALFIVIGYLFANGLSLMDHVEVWPRAWQNHQVAGAATGTALQMYDDEILPRWLLMIGLALGTTAAWCAIDAAWFAREQTADYRRWAVRFSLVLAIAGAIWFAVAGSWYVFGTWPTETIRQPMFTWPMILLTVATAVAPGLPVALLALAAWRGLTRAGAAAIGAAQFGVLAVNAASRQTLQNLRIWAYLDLAGRPAAIEGSPLALFLVLLVIGAIVVLWMVAQAVKAAASSA